MVASRGRDLAKAMLRERTQATVAGDGGIGL
jgi:hypothetical protein